MGKIEFHTPNVLSMLEGPERADKEKARLTNNKDKERTAVILLNEMA